MFAKLFAEAGLSLDRLRALLEVGAAGSIVKAADADPVRQSQYSRQIKELEDFFRAKLIERQGKGSRLTANGKELARISRFFMLGLSNFQRGCLAKEQTFCIGANSTFIRQFLLPSLSGPLRHKGPTIYATETTSDEEIERRLHDLTLDFGVVGSPTLSRPLQTRGLGEWKLQLWVPKRLRLSETKAVQAFEQQRLPLALARELDGLRVSSFAEYEAPLTCNSFVDVAAAMDGEEFAGLLPDFLIDSRITRICVRMPFPKIDSLVFHYHLAWNPRLLRLNPPAARRRDWLADALAKRMSDEPAGRLSLPGATQAGSRLAACETADKAVCATNRGQRL